MIRYNQTLFYIGIGLYNCKITARRSKAKTRQHDDHDDDDDGIEVVETMIAEKKALLKKSEDVYEFDRLSAELEGLEWLQRQIARLVWG
jgi:hypothetical protein